MQDEGQMHTHTNFKIFIFKTTGEINGIEIKLVARYKKKKLVNSQIFYAALTHKEFGEKKKMKTILKNPYTEKSENQNSNLHKTQFEFRTGGAIFFNCAPI